METSSKFPAMKNSFVEFSPKELSVIGLLAEYWNRLMIMKLAGQSGNTGLFDAVNAEALSDVQMLTSSEVFAVFPPRDVILLIEKLRSAMKGSLEMNPELAESIRKQLKK